MPVLFACLRGQDMRITGIDNYTLNGPEGLVCRYLGGHGAVQINAQSRNRAGLHPVIDSFTQRERTATLQVYQQAGWNMHRDDLNELVHEIFHPPLGKRVLTMEYNGDTYTTECYVTSLEMPNDTLTVRWLVQITIPSGVWHGSEPVVYTDLSEPVIVEGNVPALPTLVITGGEPVTRQRVTYTDRTGHGVSAYLVSVVPVDDLAEHQYIIYANGLQIPFRLADGRLFFRIDAPPPPDRVFVDIYGGESINNTVTAGRLDPAGTTLNAALSAGTVEADTAAAISNPLAPSLAWHPSITYRHESRRPYVFGLDGNVITLVDDNVVSERNALPDDVDSLIFVSGSEAERIRNLGLEIYAGYQPSLWEALRQGPGGSQVMRVQFHTWPARVPRLTWPGLEYKVRYTVTLQLGDQMFPPPGVNQVIIDATSEEGEEDPTVFPPGMFEELIDTYLPDVEVIQGQQNMYYLYFPDEMEDLPRLQLHVQPFPPRIVGFFNWEIYIAPRVSVAAQWVDPLTLMPFNMSLRTSHLTDTPIPGVIRAVVKYRARDSEHWVTAWSRNVVGFAPDGQVQQHNNLNIATPGAVEIAIGLEPVPGHSGVMNWGHLKVTSTPTIDLAVGHLPTGVAASPISAMCLNGLVRNLRTGARLQIQDYLVDGGLEIDTSNMQLMGLGGVGPVYGSLRTSAGVPMFQLLPGENEVQASGQFDDDDVEIRFTERLAT